MTRILLADDHKLLVDGLRLVLDKERTLEVVGVATDGLEATRLAQQLHPDVVLMDISMPQQNGIDAARNILHILPQARIIMLSMHADRRFIQASLRAGACGYILKESAAREVIAAINTVQEGKLFFSRTIRDQVLHDYAVIMRDDNAEVASPLSCREREVLQVLAEGKSTKDAADILCVSVKTIESHRKQIMDKLDLHSIAELTKYAIREGLTPLN